MNPPGRPFLHILALLLASYAAGTVAAEADYLPCPLLRAYFPVPKIDPSSESIRSLTQGITTTLNNLMETGHHDVYGQVTPNTTSLSIVLFTGGSDAGEDPVFFEYSYKAPSAQTAAEVSSLSVFPVGDLTQLFTVYSWLVKMGDRHWETPITEFIPELAADAAGDSSGPGFDWEDVTIGSLAGHMSGLTRDSECASTDASRQHAHILLLYFSCPF